MNILKQQFQQLKTTVDSVVSAAIPITTTSSSSSNHQQQPDREGRDSRDRDTRVIVHDNVQVRGNIHRLLHISQFSSSMPAALVSSAQPHRIVGGDGEVEEEEEVTMLTTFVLAIGSMRIPIVASMDLLPNYPKVMEREKELASAAANTAASNKTEGEMHSDAEKENTNTYNTNTTNPIMKAMIQRMRSFTVTSAFTDPLLDDHAHGRGESMDVLFTDDQTLSIVSKDGKYLSIRLINHETFLRWHIAIRESISELMFTRAFQLNYYTHEYLTEGQGNDNNKKKMLSIRRLELAIQRGQLLIPKANCHFLRAKRLWNLKMDLNELVHRIHDNPSTISREEVISFLNNRCSCDRVSFNFICLSRFCFFNCLT